MFLSGGNLMKKFLGLMFICLFSGCGGCGGSNTSDIQSMDISDAKALMTSLSSGVSASSIYTSSLSNNTSSLLKITNDNYILEVSYTLADGTTTIDYPYVVKVIHNINDNFVLVGFLDKGLIADYELFLSQGDDMTDFLSSNIFPWYIVRKSDGKSWNIRQSVGEHDCYTIDSWNGPENNAPIIASPDGNLYYRAYSCGGNSEAAIIKISNLTTEPTFTVMTNPDVFVHTFFIDNTGNIVYSAYPNPNSGTYQPDSVRYIKTDGTKGILSNASGDFCGEKIWKAIDGNIYYNGTNGKVYKAFSSTPYYNDDIRPIIQYIKYLLNIGNKTLGLESRNSHEVRVIELFSDQAFDIENIISLEQVTNSNSGNRYFYAVSSGNNYYVAGSDKMLKCDADHNCVDHVTGYNFDHLTVDSQDKVTFSATRLSDNQNVVATVDVNGTVEVIGTSNTSMIVEDIRF